MRTFFSLLFMLAINFLIAQPSSEQHISKSLEYIDEVKTDSILSFYTNEQGVTGVIRDSKKNFVFDVFDEQLTKVFTQIINHHKKETIVGDLFFENEVKIFTEFAVKKNERILYCHIFNIKDHTHKKVQVFKTIIDGRQALYSEMKDHQTLFAISPNGDYLGVAAENLNKDDDSFLVKVFNSRTLQIVYQNKIVMDPDNYFKINELIVDNNAVVYSLGKLFLEGRSQKKGGAANYEFVLNRISIKSNKGLSIVLEEMHIETLSITVKQDKIHLLGLFSEKNISKVKGGCNFIVNPETLTVVKMFKADLPIEVYKEIYGQDKARTKRNKELSNFNIDYILNDNNGNTYILAEEFYITGSPV